MDNLIKRILRRMDYTISDEDMQLKFDFYMQKINTQNYDFSTVKIESFTQRTYKGKKRRMIYSFENDSVENILCEYLKIKIDNTFHIKYANRKKIMNSLFNTLPIIKDLNDFVIIRFDFKSFFDSVSTSFVYETFIVDSIINRRDKEIFKKFCYAIPYCYAGLQTSNAMTELACIDFDDVFKSKLKRYGIVYCERYVDDVLIIINNYASESIIRKIVDESIKDVFKMSKVSINNDKFNYISRRNITSTNEFDFLGYNFILNHSIVNGKEKFDFEYGITDAKIYKYTSKIKQMLLEYKISGNVELLRHRIKFFSSRIVYSLIINDTKYDWVTKGLVENYGELKFHLENLDNKTKKFLQKIYYNQMNVLGIDVPYFMTKHYVNGNESIYNIYSNMKRNRSIVLDYSAGLKINQLVKEIRKINPTYYCGDKTYYQVAKNYLDILKLQ